MDNPRKFVNPLFFNAMSSAPFKRTATVLAFASLLSACSVLQEDKIDYKSATKAPTLEVPPDLTQLRKESRFAIESTSATASGFQNAGSRVVDAGTASNALGPARIERQGNQRWLVVSLPADKVWEPLREFWTSNGFVLVTDAPDVGIMETEWAENRAKLPQDFIRKTLGKVLDSFYSTGERDKFRTRVERNAQGGVEIYITHRGMIENYADAQKNRTIWQPRPSDPELEIEFLRRLMVKLGTAPEAPKTATAIGNATDTGSQVSSLNGQPVIVLPDNLDRAWRRTGVALDRSGFTVEDRDRSAGVYFVRYVAAGTSTEPSGFLGRLFGSKKDTPSTLTKYQIKLTPSGENQTDLRVLTASGQHEPSAQDAERILKLIAAELR
jgi:outer membrane protein assembly factor BamC